MLTFQLLLIPLYEFIKNTVAATLIVILVWFSAMLLADYLKSGSKKHSKLLVGLTLILISLYLFFLRPESMYAILLISSWENIKKLIHFVKHYYTKKN